MPAKCINVNVARILIPPYPYLQEISSMEKPERLVTSAFHQVLQKVSEATTAAESRMAYVSCREALSDWRNVIEVVSLAADPC